MMRFDHLSAWALVGAMMAIGLAWSAAPGAGGAPVALKDDPTRLALAEDRRAFAPLRPAWTLGLALGGSAGVGVERYDDREPPWLRETPVAAQSLPAASTTSRKPIRTCLSPSDRECRAAGRHTPHPLSSHEPPLTM